MKKSKLLIAATVLAVGAAAVFAPASAYEKASAGSSKTYVVSSNSIGKTSVNSGDLFVTGKISVENGKIKFNEESEVETVSTKTKAFNLKKYGITTLLDFTSTFSFSSLNENGEFVVAFGMDDFDGEVGAEDSFALKIKYDASQKRYVLSVSEYLSDGTEQAIFSPQIAGAIQTNRDVTFKVFVDTDCNLTVSMKQSGAANETVFVKNYSLNVNPEGYVSYFSIGRNNITLSDPQIFIYKYDTPETIDYVETFDENGYNSNVFYSESTASPFTPSSLSVENGALVFKNTAAAYISTRYKYSNFELSFDITDMAREAVSDDNGNILSLINSWFGIAFGLNSENEAPDSTVRYSTWLQVGRVFPDEDDFVTPNVGHYLLWDNNGDFNGVTTPQYMTDFNPWDTSYDGEVINVKLTVTDGLIEYFMKVDGDPDYGAPYFSYNLGKTKTGYIRIFTAGETTINPKGLKYNNVGNFTIDNLSIKNTDFESEKKLLPSPGYKSNLWDKTPDYDYKTNLDDNDLLGNKIKNGNIGTTTTPSSQGGGCNSSIGFVCPVAALAALAIIGKKRK